MTCGRCRIYFLILSSADLSWHWDGMVNGWLNGWSNGWLDRDDIVLLL